MMHKRVRVLVGEFEDLIAIGLRQLLSDDGSVELVAESTPVDQLDAELGRLAPTVAVVDFAALPRPALVNELLRSHPQTRLIVLADNPSASEAMQMLSLGAAACIHKGAQARDIMTAIHLASRGMNVVPRSHHIDGAPRLVGPTPLTMREAEVLGLLQDGRSNAEIALALSVGIETVRTHARNIYRKLGVSSRRELVHRPTPTAFGRHAAG